MTHTCAPGIGDEKYILGLFTSEILTTKSTKGEVKKFFVAGVKIEEA